ncbi:MAG: sensor histidine kinase [Methanobacteriaceae archaeon]|nr:sensor histidine kinase [Methanobacteriaceae archaeon]
MNYFIPINIAIPLGLIINELITNSLKHTFPDYRSGEISIDFHQKEDSLELSVKDEGIGFPEDLDYRSTRSLGLQLINSLTEQIDGQVEMDGNNGTSFKITFKNQNNE